MAKKRNMKFPKKTKLIALLCVFFFLLGCGNQWIPKRQPETEAERIAVAEMQLKILSKIPSTLSGHDQDWDDAIKEAHKIACDTICKTRLYEWDGFRSGFTGQKKELQ